MKSHSDYRSHKLQKEEARKLLGRIIREYPDNVLFSRHAVEELAKDNLTVVYANNILRSTDAQILVEGEFEKGSYRYRLETTDVCLIIVFNSDQELVVITAWRKQK